LAPAVGDEESFLPGHGPDDEHGHGTHVAGLALTLDTLSRELGVLFVVATGNLSGAQLTALAWKDEYPDYLSSADWTLIDPATALNALTVGSIARFDRSHASGRYPTDPSEVALARRDQPSPFTRHGPSVGGAVKPEVVAYGGNWALNTLGAANYLVTQGLGEVSTNLEFAGGKLLAADAGTSFAAPHVAQLAAPMLVERPDAPPELLRALLLAHANVPPAATALIPQSDTCRSVVGYGVIDRHALFRSLENDVSLVAVETIANKRHHLYEIQVPEDFLSPGRRDREIAIALAYTPAVRSTRVAYKASRRDFKLVAGPDIEHVSKMFSRSTDKDDYENIAELKVPDCNGQVRGKGTVQKATWRFRQFNGRSILKDKSLARRRDAQRSLLG
jgi:subtilisin family serine protease